jgi:hypothetical protein
MLNPNEISHRETPLLPVLRQEWQVQSLLLNIHVAQIFALPPIFLGTLKRLTPPQILKDMNLPIRDRAHHLVQQPVSLH